MFAAYHLYFVCKPELAVLNAAVLLGMEGEPVLVSS